MKIDKILLALFLLSNHTIAQGTFQSINSGNWNDPTVWTLTSGISTTNYPVSGDTVNVVNGNIITVNVNSQCNQLNVTGASLLLNTSVVTLIISNSVNISASSTVTINQGFMTVTGSLTEGSSSSVTINQGALTVIGLMFLNSPTTATGTTLLDVEGGAFSCAGGMSITATTIPSGRFAELRIGNSAVNIGGGLATITANARINFTGTGALTLAGVISISNPASFIPGNGKVIYFGIPGSDQIIAPLTYYRLFISGIGSGLKKISGIVTVTDTLSLLTDTLEVMPGGVLNINDQATVVKTAGRLISPPTYAGVADIVYNNILKDTTGMEVPASEGVLRNLTIDDASGITLTSDITVNNVLNLQSGAFITNGYSLNIVNPNGGVATDPAILRTNGYVIGAINRTIGNSTGVRIFPFGISASQGYREFQINYTTAPAMAGNLTVEHFNTPASNQSGLPLTDGSVVITNAAPMYWQADASGLSGGIYNLTLTAEGTTGVTNLNNLRIIKRPSSGGGWIADGTAGTNSGSNTAPVIVRNNMSGFSQFTFGGDAANVLPIKIEYFSSEVSGKSVVLTWSAEPDINTAYFEIQSSKDGNNLTGIGKVNYAYASKEAVYSFTDNNATYGNNYYRLKVFDTDGNYYYSNVVTAKIQAGAFKLYPTIAAGIVNVESESNIDLKVYNASGQYVQKLVTGVNDISRLGKGIYYATDGNNIIKFVKQ